MSHYLYYVPWIMLILASICVSLGGFFWALRHGQFDEQNRARYLPLRGEGRPTPAKRGRGAIREIYLLASVLFMGAAGIAAAGLTMILANQGVGR
jgi:cbb3-type cytochrome oxidase maturation protein